MVDRSGTDKPGYKGSERRKIARRYTSDRRKEIRWEPKNPNRRESMGRRASDQLDVFGKR